MCSPLSVHRYLQARMDSFSLTADISSRSTSTDNSLPSIYISRSVGAGIGCSSLWMCSPLSVHSYLQAWMDSFSLTADISSRSTSTDSSMPSIYISRSVGAGIGCSSLWMCSPLSVHRYLQPRMDSFSSTADISNRSTSTGNSLSRRFISLDFGAGIGCSSVWMCSPSLCTQQSAAPGEQLLADR